MIGKIKKVIEKIDEISKNKKIKIISHYDTDGITSAAIFSRAMERWGKRFSLQVVKGLDEEFVRSLPEDNLIIFLDLGSGSLNQLAFKNTEIIILDHHEVTQEIPENVTMINPITEGYEQICSAGVCYLFAKTLSKQNLDLATLAVIGMVGDNHGKNLGKTYTEIINDSDTTIKKGLMIYPSTRPLNRTLEYSSSPYIPGVTGSGKGTIELLREAGIPKENGSYKALYELTETEMSNLITAIMLRGTEKKEQEDLVGNLYLVKFFNKLEDARELSALINACSRMDKPYLSLGFCLGNKRQKQEAEKAYIDYKQSLVSALKHVSEMDDKIFGKKYTIINGKDKIKDTIIGTVASIISHSPVYEKGTVVVALAYTGDKVKVSARVTGEKGRNVREVLSKVVVPIGGEVGGHPGAAGCLIDKEKEGEFIEEIKKVLDIEIISPESK